MPGIPYRHEDRTAIVTGGGGVIGTATSVRLAREGANVVVADRRDDVANRVVERIHQLGGSARYVPTDLAAEAEIAALVETTVDCFGGVEIVINNAAIHEFAPAESMSREQWDDTLAVNLTAPYRLAQHSIEYMQRAGFGRIVNVGAIQSHSPLTGAVGYASAKSGLHGLTRSMAVEWSGGPDSITANTVLMGPIYEDNDPLDEPDRPPEEVHDDVPATADAKAATLVGRWGRASEAAATIAFLAGPESGFVTGGIIPCDGGRLISRQSEPIEQTGHLD